MVVLQALLTLLSRSLGRIFRATFGWAVTALFGERPGREKTVLSMVVAASAAWPLLVLGIPFPRVAAMVLALVPVSERVAPTLLRVGWLLLALLVPFVLGLTLARFSNARAPTEPAWKRLLRGYPTTLALAAAFALLLVIMPLRKVVAVLRRRADTHLPLVVTAEAYDDTASRIERTLRDAGLELVRCDPPWWLAAPSSVLRKLGGGALAREIPPRLFYLEGAELYALLSPNGVTLHGREFETTRLRGLLSEALAFGQALQTLEPEAQILEKRLNDLRMAFEASPEARQRSGTFHRGLEAMAEELLSADLPQEDWETLYRQMLQLSRAFAGASPLLRKADGAGALRSAPQPEVADMTNGRTVRELSTGELLGEIASQVQLLARKEVDLARAEAKTQIARELKMARGLAMSAACLVIGVTLALVAAILAVAQTVPGWAAALGAAFLVMAVGAVAGARALAIRVKKLLAVTRETLEDHVRWARNRFA